jgi:glycerate kinase
MKVLIACDSFKGCMSSEQANFRVQKGMLEADPSLQVRCFSISDGGEGFVEAFSKATGAKVYRIFGKDLYGKTAAANYAFDLPTRTACIDAASVLGLTLYPVGRRKPMQASSYGLGLLLQTVMERNAQRVIIGLGGTGTNDGGMGLLSAFGIKFYDENRKLLEPCAANLQKIAFIDKRYFRIKKNVELIAACDVTNRLLGKYGATYVYGRQKGLKALQLESVEEGMVHYAAKLKQTFHKDFDAFEGGGAAGGLGAVLQGVLGASFESGFDILSKAGGLEDLIAKADLVVTGEGQSDAQSVNGKVVDRIGHMSYDHGTTAICIAGALGSGADKLYDNGICALFSTADRCMSFPTALQNGPDNLEREAFNIMRLIKAVRKEV